MVRSHFLVLICFSQRVGFDHSAFTFASESNVDKSDVNPSDVLPGSSSLRSLFLICTRYTDLCDSERLAIHRDRSLCHGGESHHLFPGQLTCQDGGDASPPPQPVSLLSPYSSLQNLPNTPLKGSLSLSTSTPAAPSDSVSSLKRARPGATSFSLFLPYASETNHNDPSDVVSRQPNTIPILPSDVSLLSGPVSPLSVIIHLTVRACWRGISVLVESFQ